MDSDTNQTNSRSDLGTLFRGCAIAVFILGAIFAIYGYWVLKEFTEATSPSGVGSGRPATVDRDYQATPEVPIDSIAAEAGIPEPRDEHGFLRYEGLNSREELISGAGVLYDYRQGYSGARGITSGTVDGNEWTFPNAFSPELVEKYLDAREHFTTITLKPLGNAPSVEFAVTCTTELDDCARDAAPHTKALIQETPESTSIYKQVKLILTDEEDVTATLWTAGARTSDDALGALDRLVSRPELTQPHSEPFTLIAQRDDITVRSGE